MALVGGVVYVLVTSRAGEALPSALWEGINRHHVSGTTALVNTSHLRSIFTKSPLPGYERSVESTDYATSSYGDLTLRVQ